MAEQDNNGAAEALPPPPPVPSDVTPVKAEAESTKKKAPRLPMARRGFGSKGQKIPILTNHFKVNVSKNDGHFFHYSVALYYEDGRPVDSKGIGRKVLDRVHETYDTELAGKEFAYDGEKSLFTVGALPRNKLEFTVVLEDVTSNRNNGNCSPGSPNEGDKKRLRRPYRSKTYKVEISFAAKIPMNAIANALRGQESENSQEALRVLDIILRQHAAKQGCLLVRQSFFHNDPKNFASVGGGVLGCRGFHSSFRTTQGGLSLNIDTSTTMIIQPGPVVDFLIANQNAKDPFSLDWAKAKRMLKNLRVTTSPTNQEYKISGLSEKSCREQTFTLKQKSKEDDGEVQNTEVTVYDYFVNQRNIDLRYSADLPCINVGKPKRPTYFPIELCSLVSLQRYTKALSTFQRASLVEKSRQKPQERMQVLSNALKINNYDAEPLLNSCGISINNNFTQIEGRVLPAPKLKVGNGEDFFPRNGRWNFNNKKLVEPAKIERWAVVNFSARCDIRGLVRDLMKCGEMKGISVEPPFDVFEENPQFRRAPPVVRVEKMFEDIQSKLPGAPKFLLCLLPERKNCDVYGPWKRKNLADHGIVTQCMSPTRVNDQYLTNCLLKINAKVTMSQQWVPLWLLFILPVLTTFLSNASLHLNPLFPAIQTLSIVSDYAHALADLVAWRAEQDKLMDAVGGSSSSNATPVFSSSICSAFASCSVAILQWACGGSFQQLRETEDVPDAPILPISPEVGMAPYHPLLISTRKLDILLTLSCNFLSFSFKLITYAEERALRSTRGTHGISTQATTLWQGPELESIFATLGCVWGERTGLSANTLQRSPVN
nr:protein argonaute 4 [Ipomoea batatas]